MRILVFYPYIPYPIDRGTYQRTFHLLRELAREHEVDLLALSEGGERMEHRAVFEEFCHRVEFVPFEHLQWPRLHERLLDPKPTTIRHWDLAHVAAALDGMLRRGNYDLVHACDIVLAQFFLHAHTNVPLVIDRSRVDLQFQLEQHATMSHGLKVKILDYENLAKLAAFEKQVARRSMLQVVCGPDDEVFIRKHISKTAPVLVVGNGVDLSYFHPDAAPGPRAEEPTILFCGAMDYTPNVDALRWFFGEGIHDGLLQRVPNLRTLIVGKSPTDEVKAHGARQGVIVTGGVPDVRPYYRRAWLQVVPLRIGGGTRLKIVESLAFGTPVVSTSIGAQGLDLVHGQDVLLADSVADFVEQTASALVSADLRDRIEARGVEVARSRFSWRTIAARLSKHYSHLHQQTQTPLKLAA
ncbi:MAG: glycosyltransferase [Roseimicrobium sp.]